MRNYRRAAFLIVLLIILSSLLLNHESVNASEKSRGYGEPAQSKLFRKNPSYTPIQPLIDAVPSNGELVLGEENYAGPLTIDKPITIRGQGERSVIYLSEEEQTITIRSDDVQLTNFVIVDNRNQPQAPVIQAEGITNASIKQLIIQSRSTAMKLVKMKHSELLNNEIVWNGAANTKRTDRGNGIYLYDSNDITIESNTITGVYDGIYAENSVGLKLRQNKVSNSRYGYHMMYAEAIELTSNEGFSNVTGFMIMTSNDIVLRQNKLTGHQANANASAILIYDVLDAEVYGNEIGSNRIGVTVERSEKVKVTYNNLRHNFVALQLQRSEELVVEHNDFIGNVSNVWDDGSSKPTIQHNYWDTLQGLDLDGDGYSELSYKSSPFFLALIERRPSFQILFGTTGIGFIEQLYQGSSQHWLSDTAPSIELQLQPNSAGVISQQQGAGGGAERSMMLIGWALLTIGAVIFMIKVRRYEQ